MRRRPLPPTVLTEEGRALRVTRAWPLVDQAELSLECEEAGQRRAGTWDGSNARLQPLGTDSRLADLAELARGGVVVSHRPGRRAVVRRDQQFIKVVRRGRAGAVLDGIRRASTFAASFRTPEVLGHTRSTVTFRALEGASLHDPKTLEPRQWERAWVEVLSAWSRSVSASATGVPGADGPSGSDSSDSLAGSDSSDSSDSSAGSAGVEMPEHSAEDEILVLAHWARLVEPYVHPGDRLRRSVERVSDELAALPRAQLRPAHRDLHDKQLLWSPGDGPGLLDVDTACLADPALDLGNLRAHARLRRLQGIWAGPSARTVVGAVDAAAEQLGVPGESLAVYERAAVLRLGCVYAVRPAYVQVAAAMRARAAQPA